MKRTGLSIKPCTLGVFFFLLADSLLYGHIADEIAVKTTIDFNEDDIRFSFDISSGVLFSTVFLRILDPDKNKSFEAEHVAVFSDFFLEKVEILSGGGVKQLDFAGFSASEWDYFAAGISTVILEYSLPRNGDEAETVDLRYKFSFYSNVAVYSLNIKNNIPGKLAILREKRNEYLQNIVDLQYTGDPELIAALVPKKPAPLPPGPAIAAASPSRSPPAAPAKTSPGDLLRNGFEVLGIMGFLRGGGAAPEAGTPDLPAALPAAVFFILAVVVGFLHAFTPGHGKALVGAFLIANQGTAFHALCLGLVITLTHTASIYAFGLLASTAAQFFLPGEFIPLLSLLSGLFITGLGIRLFAKRLLGTELDHAHLLPNLQLLNRETVNILIDGAAAEANEAILIAAWDEGLQESLKAAGAENFNLCSPGCSTHTRLPPLIRERQHAEFFKMAIKTGAVDAVVTPSSRTIRHLGRLRNRTWVEKYDPVSSRPRELLFRAIRNYSSRGEISMPENKLSWGRVISLGVSGGIVPCPDALAVLLVAIAVGKIALGMGIILLFSMGLASALIIVGMIIVATKRLLTGQKRLSLVIAFFPYISSLFITLLGVLMVTGVVRNFFRFG
ncbi:MAG: sulfite exporter TauE/SafE family protein [Treponema sp.]|jgi:ABC-type nickel/cobalt efflux system permease component RcnA|nr:sulfite exporter TauE/SafE family protein [Treponema sp.]